MAATTGDAGTGVLELLSPLPEAQARPPRRCAREVLPGRSESGTRRPPLAARREDPRARHWAPALSPVPTTPRSLLAGQEAVRQCPLNLACTAVQIVGRAFRGDCRTSRSRCVTLFFCCTRQILLDFVGEDLRLAPFERGVRAWTRRRNEKPSRCSFSVPGSGLECAASARAHPQGQGPADTRRAHHRRRVTSAATSGSNPGCGHRAPAVPRQPRPPATRSTERRPCINAASWAASWESATMARINGMSYQLLCAQHEQHQYRRGDAEDHQRCVLDALIACAPCTRPPTRSRSVAETGDLD